MAGLAFIFASLARKKLARNHISVRVPLPRSPVEWLLSVVLVVEIATIYWISFKHTLGWDGVLVWEIKARYAFLNGRRAPGRVFPGCGTRVQSSGLSAGDSVYPALDLPLAGRTQPVLGEADLPDVLCRGSGPFDVDRLRGSRASDGLDYCSATLLFFIPQASLSTGSAIVGYADFPLSIYYLATMGYLWLMLGRNDSFGVFAMCLGCLPWIKNEGAILWLVGAGTASMALLASRWPRRRLLYLAPGLFVIVGWRLFLRSVAVAPTRDFLAIRPSTFLANAHRLPSICRVIAAEFMTWENWGVYWLIVALAGLVLLYHWRLLSNRLLLVAALLPFSLYSGVYVFSAWHLYLEHVASSIPRLLAQLVPVTLLAIGAAVAQFLRTGETKPSGATADALGSSGA